MGARLEGKVALVTGASSGIGEATAHAISAEGAKVAVCARHADGLEKLTKRITKHGRQVLALVGDVEKESDANEMVDKTKSTFGRLDIVVNNAGVASFGTIEEGILDEWRQVINTNLLGLMYVTHAALPVMKEQKSGHFVNVSSVAGRIARAGSAVYSASKWGVEAFSEALRQEVSHEHIRVTVIEPGVVATEIASHMQDERGKQEMQHMLESLTPLTSEDIASSIVYALVQPERVSINEILIRPTEQDH